MILGVAIAFWQPGTVQEPPMLERGLRWLTAWRNGEWYQWSSPTPDVGSLPLDMALTPPTGLPSRSVPSTASTPAAPNNGSPSTETSDAAQGRSTALSSTPSALAGEAANDELAQLQADLAKVRDRLQTLEDQLNLDASSSNTDPPSIEERLARIEAEVSNTPINSGSEEQTSNAEGQTRPVIPPTPVPPPPFSLASPSILPEPAGTLSHGSPSFPIPLSNNALRVTLPSDTLFDGESTELKPSAYPLLDSIAEELKTFSSATIRVSVHTDDAASSASNRALALARSQAICHHLSPNLGESYRWVVIGYGESRPLMSGDSPLAQERNRRVEITIEPN